MDWRFRLVVFVCLSLCAGVDAFAVTQPAPGTVQFEIQRRVGYVIGDLIPYDVLVTVDPSWTLRRSSLPAPGYSQYWLDLRTVDVDDARVSGNRRYRINLVYQIFYAPIEARKRALPGFTLTFDHGGTTSEITVPALSITMSPLREVASGAGDTTDNLALVGDRAPRTKPLLQPLLATVIAATLSLLFLAIVCWKRAWWPFARRPDTPFTQAARLVRKSDLTDSRGYGAALLALHRAIDSTAGWHVFADDLQKFLAQQPRFAAAGLQIAEFFAASRRRFFGDDSTQAEADLPGPALVNLSERLADLERRA